MKEDVVAMQREAEQRVKRMQEQNRRLLENGPTFGGALLRQPACPGNKSRSEQMTTESREDTRLFPLLLLLLLLLLQGGDERVLLVLLAYLL